MKFTRAMLPALLLFVGVGLAHGQETPELPAPSDEHKWLEQLVGEWEGKSTLTVEPGKPTMEYKCSEKVEMLGGFWAVGRGSAEMFGMKISTLQTLGYDTNKKKYVGTWVDSMTGYLWTYEGTLDESGKKLSLETEGPCPLAAGKLTKFVETIELKNKDHKVFSSKYQDPDGDWVEIVTVDYRRK